MNKKWIVMAAAAVTAASAAVGGSLAALNTNTENNAGAAQAGISLKDIGISVANNTGVVSDSVAANPGGAYANEHSYVTNTAAGGYAVYTKVVIDHSFADADASLVTLYIGDSYEDGTPLPTSLQDGAAVLINDWLVCYADEEQTVMYYTKPLEPGENTTDFLDGIYFSPQMGNSYADTQYNLDIAVTAVQFNNGYDAIASELGVFATFDADGNITAISERKEN